MNENISQPILNPAVYLNYLQPSIASEYEAVRNIFLVTLGASMWDILSSLPEDWVIIRTTKISPVLFAYFSSRLSALAVVFMSVMATTGPVRNCSVIQLILCIFLILTTGSSSYLFLKRVHAVFFQEKLVCHAFTVLWVAVVGASSVVLPGTVHTYYEIANTRHCINDKFEDYVSAGFIVPMVFDALVYFAITFKVYYMSHCHATTKPIIWKMTCRSKTLPRLSRAVLQGGQQYYSITNGVNVTRSIIALSHNYSPLLQFSSSIPVIVLTSVMACRVFRNLHLEASQKTDAGPVTTIHFADRPAEHVSVDLTSAKDAECASTTTGLEQCRGSG